MKDPTLFTIAVLKEQLKRMNLSIAGNKAELIARLQEADPCGQWIYDIEAEVSGTNEASGDATNAQNASEQRSESPIGSFNLRGRERDLEARERSLLQKELELLRRENEQLRSTMQTNPSAGAGMTTAKASLTNLKEMLSQFDGKKGAYPCWKEQLLTVKQIYRLDDNTTKMLLAAKLSGDAADWFHSIPSHLSLAPDEILRRMEAMFGMRERKLALRKEFENKEWQYGETFTDYCHKKIILANKISIDEEELVDYIIDGIPIRSMRDQAMMQQFPDKESLIKAMENMTLRSEQKTSHKSEKVFGARHARTAESTRKAETDVGGKQEPKCFNCNEMGHIAVKCSKPKRERGACYKCLQQGHRAKDCTSKEQTKNEVSKDADKQTSVHSVFEELKDFRREIDYQISNENENVTLNCKLDTLLDTGSPISFIKNSFVPPNLIMSVLAENKNYCGLNNSVLEIEGRVAAQMALGGMEQKRVSLLVVPAKSMRASVVIGRDVLMQFFKKEKFLSENLENEVIKEVLNINVDKENVSETLIINSKIEVKTIEAVKELFVEEYVKSERPDQPLSNAEIELRLKEEKPFHFSPYRPSYAEKKELRALLDSLLERSIIRHSESEYASPIVLVRKKSGELRLCIDYRELNKLLLKDNYPLPNIEDLIDSLHGKRYFTKLDLKNGFYHIRVAERSIKYTAFTTPFGQYEFRYMPFGLKVAPPRFQRYINQILVELIRQTKVVAYMDDILVISETVEQHLEILKDVFKLFVANKLELRIDKCSFLQNEIEFVGYLVSEKGIKPTKEGVKAVQKIPVPRNIKEVHSFVALCSYFRKFIPSFSLIAKPLYDLLRKNVQFKIGEKELHAIEELKEKITDSPVLSIYNPNNETELHCDASSAGFGAVLMQRGGDGYFHPTLYFSKRTTEVESRYHSFELEMLAIIYSLRRFKVYLRGMKFKIVTDCNALALAVKKKELSPRISRWILELSEYDYVTEHRPGVKMGHVDALSRLPDGILVIEDNSFELNLALSQSKDRKLGELKEILQSANDPYFEMRNGIIFRKHDKELLFYIPQAMELQVLHKYHDELGHLGTEKTYGNIIKSYWFPELKQKVKRYVSNCLKCISFAPLEGKREGYLHPIPKGQLPFEMYHVDHYGPIDKDRAIKRYLLVIVDAFTKFVKLYPTKTTATQEVINQLTTHFANYSRPRVLVSDRGAAFTSNEFKSFCTENNIQHVCTATHSPKANGQVERINRIVGPMISKLIDNDAALYWYKVISDIEFAINNTTHKTTNETPSKLLFGVDQRGKVVDAIREYLVSKSDECDRDLERLRVRAAERIRRNQKYTKEYFDKKRKQACTYKIGDMVMIKNIDTTKGASHKIIPKFKGPYEVMRILRNDRYVIKDVSGHQATQKPYEGTWEAANMRPWMDVNSSEGGAGSELAEL